jgi:putative NIF3 family GTP cyclohydrolase 1 type 2
MGRVGELKATLGWNAFCRMVQSRFPHAALRVAGRVQESVRRVAVCGGSGTSLLGSAHQEGAQVLLTGDGKYHDARKAEALGITLLDVGHFASEGILVPWLVELLKRESDRSAWGLDISAFEEEREPFRVLARNDWTG